MVQNNYNGALQKPIGSGFNAKSTTSEVTKDIGLSGKTAIVTGGYNGLGLEITRTLTSVGATVIVPARDIDKAKNNLSGIPIVEIQGLDLTNPKSIDAFATSFLASERALHPGLILEIDLGRYLTFDDYVALGAVDAQGNPNPEYETATKNKQKTTEQGAAASVWAATSPQLQNIGGVSTNCKKAECSAKRSCGRCGRIYRWFLDGLSR